LSKIAQVTSSNFQELVLTSFLPVIVDFGAEWCAPCRRLEPILETLSSEWQQKALILQLNVEEASDIATQYAVLNLPTLILFIKGIEHSRLIGMQSHERIVEKFGPLIIV
jgi:thioredoxin 1